MIGGYDIETTGLKWGDHRIIEVALLRYSDDGDYIDKFVQRINPQRSIDPAAERVHKISAADLVSEPDWSSVALELVAVMNECDLVVAHNGEYFDFPFTNHELGRIGRPTLKVPCFDTMLKGRWASPVGAVPSLQLLSFACGVEYDPEAAHAAEYDVQKMMDCFFFGRRTGFFTP